MTDLTLPFVGSRRNPLAGSIAATTRRLPQPFFWPRVRNLPEAEREPFTVALAGQTRPWIDGEPAAEQDAYYTSDYDRWKAGLPVID